MSPRKSLGMSTGNISKPTATPRRTTPIQALSTLFKTPTRLYTPTTVSRRTRRARARTSSPANIPSTPSTPSSLPAVVLQTYSVSTDSVVLTALPSVPFCCHEDLLTMSRVQLEGVVRALNARLPRRMQIRPEDDFWQAGEDEEEDGLSRMSETEMKRRIEELVGIRAVVGKNRVPKSGLGLSRVPSAPKAVRTREAGWKMYEKTPWEMEVDDVEDLNSMIQEALMGSSPLAGRTKAGPHSRGRNNNALSHLPILQEVNEGKDEDDEDNEGRPSKRQRVLFVGATLGQEIAESRLIENMDISGSPLLAAEDDASSVNLAEPDVMTTSSLVVISKASEQGMQVPLQHRRSARIREITLKRASSVDTGKKTDLKSTILRSKTSSSRRSPCDERDSNTPREFALRLPFASTPPSQKSDSSAWSAPRILRAHSQRLVSSSQSIKTLGRSRSEKYPRASDLTFVTINRPRYRFARHKKNVTKGDKECHSLPGQPCHQNVQSAEHANRKHDEKENRDPVSKSSTIGGLYAGALPSALCGFLSPRSRAPSMSTVTSARSLNGGSSPVRTIEGDGVSEISAERVSESLGKMAVDIV